jgi:hypothetical protein
VLSTIHRQEYGADIRQYKGMGEVAGGCKIVRINEIKPHEVEKYDLIGIGVSMEWRKLQMSGDSLKSYPSRMAGIYSLSVHMG